MKLFNKNQTGFTLIEIAIVLVVVGVLLGYTVAMIPVQQELRQYSKAEKEMEDIIDNLLAFAQVNGRLPCPDTTGDGAEDTVDLFDNVTGVGPGDGFDDGCAGYFGFLPPETLGMNGDISAAGLLLDPWGLGYGYAVSNIDAGAGAFPVIDLVTANGIREEGIPAYNINPPDLFVCDDSTVFGDQTDCTPASVGNQVVGNVAVVITSLGKDNELVAGPPSNIQRENFDDFNVGTNDKVFISAPRSDSAGTEFDDIVKWISPNILFSKMIEADQLP